MRMALRFMAGGLCGHTLHALTASRHCKLSFCKSSLQARHEVRKPSTSRGAPPKSNTVQTQHAYARHQRSVIRKPSGAHSKARPPPAHSCRSLLPPLTGRKRRNRDVQPKTFRIIFCTKESKRYESRIGLAGTRGAGERQKQPPPGRRISFLHFSIFFAKGSAHGMTCEAFRMLKLAV